MGVPHHDRVPLPDITIVDGSKQFAPFSSQNSFAQIFHSTSSLSPDDGLVVPIPTSQAVYTASRGFVPSTNFHHEINAPL